MSTDASGIYTLPSSDIVNGQTGDATPVQNNFDDIEAGLTERITKTGKTTYTANQPMGGFKFTGVGDATARNEYASAGQVINGSLLYVAAASGSSTAYTIAPSPGISAYAAGQVFRWKVDVANTTTTPTLAVNGLTAGTIVWPDGGALRAGDLPLNAIVEVAVASVSSGTPTYHLMTHGRIPSGAATTFLTGDATVAVSGTYVNGPNTGSVGAAGQVWLIMAGGVFLNGSGGNMTASLRINDGSADIIDGSATGATGSNMQIALSVVVTLSAATTFTLQATDNVGGSVGVLKATAPAAGTNKATWITAVRLL
jgi:hypothetical protein